MKREVVVTITIDPTEYHGAADTPKGAVKLVKDILTNKADYPSQDAVVIECSDKDQDQKVTVKFFPT